MATTTSTSTTYSVEAKLPTDSDWTIYNTIIDPPYNQTDAINLAKFVKSQNPTKTVRITSTVVSTSITTSELVNPVTYP